MKTWYTYSWAQLYPYSGPVDHENKNDMGQPLLLLSIPFHTLGFHFMLSGTVPVMKSSMEKHSG